MRDKIHFGVAGSLLALLSTSCASSDAQGEKPNVLFICIDDLRAELGCYGSMAKSPNLDQLASEGSLFTSHYVQVPTSGASRASMLSGLYPRVKVDATNNACEVKFANKPEGENPETMFHALRRNGYYTVGVGKISHNVAGAADKDPNALQLPHSWDEMLFNRGVWDSNEGAMMGYADGTSRQTRNKQVKPYECADIDNDTYLVDGLTAEIALEKLDELSKRDEPFCLAVGFLRPHLPFVSPKKYWDLYEREDIDLSEYGIPKNTNGIGLGSSSEFNGNYKLGDEKLSLKVKASDDYARKLRHAYYASVSYTDAMVGRVLDRLKELKLDKNTIVIVWGDHGWNLGDMNCWGKHTIYEPSLKSTFMVKVPGCKRGIVNDRVIESVDIYPTLMELCGVDVDYPLDGDSFVSLLDNPKDRSWNDVAYSYWGASISMRTPDYRLTKFASGDQKPLLLFRFDGNEFEVENIADQHPDIVEELLPILKEGNKGFLNF